MSAEAHDGISRRTATLLLGVLCLTAVILRFWHLGDWNFQATEIFTLRDSLKPQFHNARPLGYLLNYFLVRPVHPLDELGMRLLPALFGVLSVPAFYVTARRLLGTRPALLGTLLLTVSPVLISYSQLARYWSLVFLFSTIFPYALYLGLRDRSRRDVIVGIVTGLLAVLSHPVAALAIVGPGLLLATRLRRDHLTRLWDQRLVRWTALVLACLAVVVTIRVVPLLHGWIAEHDKNPGSGQFLVRPRGAPGVKQIVYLLAFTESLTLPVMLSALVGLYALWTSRERSLALFLTSVAAFPVGFLTLLSIRTPVSTYYLLPAVPVFFMGAGVFLDRLFQVDWRLPRPWLIPCALTLMIIAAGAPTLISDYSNGRRYDFRGVATWLHDRLTPDDIIYSDQALVLGHYLPGRKIERLRYDLDPLNASVRTLRESGHGGALWIVAPGLSHALRTNLKQGGLIGWIYDNCRLRNTVGMGRVDFRQQYLQVYRCGEAPTPS